MLLEVIFVDPMLREMMTVICKSSVDCGGEELEGSVDGWIAIYWFGAAQIVFLSLDERCRR